MKIDLPEDNDPFDGPPNSFTIVITEDNRYIIDGAEFQMEEIQPHIEEVKENDPGFRHIVRIEGHRNARYESVFKIMALCDKMQLKPALAYKK